MSDTGPRLDPEGLDNVFTYHAPADGDVEAYQQIRNAGKALAQTIVDNVPPSRERSTAIAKIREAVMWANAGRACNPPAGPDATGQGASVANRRP